ncbi:hypothetical protein GJ699_17250 [Duganella sp. FT80W]|uniref:Uncharacterized protein n=1 Tax=Duganella guangzhouensis TaxID=2666084 RepID=A0A6I2L1J7_9BURK|nr:hypothetical protein [Duganella guangzhouensis]MRW91743.1 hypothetical protein [Duganella guangzhouensis]
MNSRLQKQAAALAALSPEDRARLERLAALAKLSPEDLWPEVWQYGFDDVEDSIDADLEAEEYFKENPGIDNAEVMAEARALVATYGKPKRKTG